MYDVDTLERCDYVLSVRPDIPMLLSTRAGSCLLYTRNKGDFIQMDLSNFPRWTTTEVPISLREFQWIHDFCIVPQEHGDLVIISAERGSMRAFNAGNGNLEWKITGTVTMKDTEKGMKRKQNKGMTDLIWPLGVTYDRRGHLFVCDKVNSCIQKFSIDGQYLGILLLGEKVERGVIVQKGEKGLGTPRWIRWSKKSSSIVVVHEKCLKYPKKTGGLITIAWYISIIKP